MFQHLEAAPKEILGDFPRMAREAAEAAVYRTEAKNKGWPINDDLSDGDRAIMSQSNGPPPSNNQGMRRNGGNMPRGGPGPDTRDVSSLQEKLVQISRGGIASMDGPLALAPHPSAMEPGMMGRGGPPLNGPPPGVPPMMGGPMRPGGPFDLGDRRRKSRWENQDPRGPGNIPPFSKWFGYN